jgi:TPP-dependent pyruvate/acetoin dehydrogenase alpha subunit
VENYRDPREIEVARQHDPLLLLRRYLEDHHLLSAGHLRDLNERVDRELDQAFVSAEQTAVPDPATALQQVLS